MATTYIGVLNGVEFTRKTDREYTHAVAYMGEDGKAYAVTFCGRPDLARKALAKEQAAPQAGEWSKWNAAERKYIRFVSGPHLVEVAPKAAAAAAKPAAVAEQPADVQETAVTPAAPKTPTKAELAAKIAALFAVAARMVGNGTARTNFQTETTLEDACKVHVALRDGKVLRWQHYQLESLLEALAFYVDYWVDLAHESALNEQAARDLDAAQQAVAAPSGRTMAEVVEAAQAKGYTAVINANLVAPIDRFAEVTRDYEFRYVLNDDGTVDILPTGGKHLQHGVKGAYRFITPDPNTPEGRRQLRKQREVYRRAYSKALDAKTAGDESAHAEMDRTRAGMDRIDALMKEAKLARCQVRMVAGPKFTGSFFVTYYDSAKQETVWDEKLGLQETFEHINRKGWPSHIAAELAGGGKTFAKLLMKPWDEDYSCYWYSIGAMAGGLIAEEVRV